MFRSTFSVSLILAFPLSACLASEDSPAVVTDLEDAWTFRSNHQTELFSETFSTPNSGRWIQTGGGRWRLSGLRSTMAYPSDGSGAPVAHANACQTPCILTMREAIDLTGLESAQLGLLRYADPYMRAGSFLRIEAWNGSEWTPLAQWSRGQGTSWSWSEEQFDLAAYLDVADFRIRFVTYSRLSYEHVQIDDVTISGTPEGEEVCGDGVVQDGEECDGNDLGGRTCVDLGFAGGTLACNEDCTHDSSACIDDDTGDDGDDEAGDDETGDDGTIDCRRAASWPQAWTDYENEVLQLVNGIRAQGASCGGVPQAPQAALRLDVRLREAARCHSLDMAVENFFNHTGSDGSSPFARMRAAGYTGRTMGENIAAGYQTPEQVVNAWMNSPGHCRNIMAGGYRDLGVGFVLEPTSMYRRYWTQNFGG